MGRKTTRTSLATALAVLGLAAALALPALASSARDGNGDQIPDKWEKANKLSLKLDQHKRDQDRDGLKNLGEFKQKTDPRDADSDDDGVEDGDDASPNDDVDDDVNDDVEDGDDDGPGDEVDDGPSQT